MEPNEFDRLETLFEKYKAKASENQWNRPNYILKLAISFEANDIQFAYKLIQRAHNLNPNRKLTNKKLAEYRGKIKNLRNVQPMNLVDKKVSIENENKIPSNLKSTYFSYQDKVKSSFKMPIFIFVIYPLMVFFLYQNFWASPRFLSHAQVVVQEPDGMATMDASLALLSGLGVGASNTDTELVYTYIYSTDMLDYIEEQLGLREHYVNGGGDFFSRLHDWNTKEDFLSFYKNHVVVEIDEKSHVVTILVQGFSPEFSYLLNKAIVNRAEWFINDIGHQLANAQIEFIQQEYELVESKLAKAQKELLLFQEKYSLLDPQAEGMAFQQITYSIEGKIVSAESELKMLQGIMSDDASQILVLKNQIKALNLQLKNERQRLSKNIGNNETLSVSEILSKFTDYKIKMELALAAYRASQISIEKSRIEAYRQLKYLIVVEEPTKPESNAYPEVLYNVTLFAVILLLLYGIGGIIISTVKELR